MCKITVFDSEALKIRPDMRILLGNHIPVKYGEVGVEWSSRAFENLRLIPRSSLLGLTASSGSLKYSAHHLSCFGTATSGFFDK